MAISVLHSAEFYNHLAHLFYAIASVDNSITRKEKEEIIRLVDEYWSQENSEQKSKEIIYNCLKKLIADKTDNTKAYEGFKNYFLENITSFDKKVKEKVMDSVYNIANATAKRNKSELILLNRLHQLLFKN